MIKVYYANIELLRDEGECKIWFKKMQPLRKEKILRCKQEQDKKRSLLAGILLKHALEQEGLCYENLVFEVQKHGKMVLKSPGGYEFSLSHAGNYALCCISSRIVGADIETKERLLFKENAKGRLDAMAKKVLCPGEYEFFLKAKAEEKAELFLKYWCRKESYSKALGTGLQMDFSKIDTEEMDFCFWSDWLDENCFFSIYAEDELTDIEIYHIKEFKS